MPVEIPGLPAALRTVPADPAAWRTWGERILDYRVTVRGKCEHDMGARAQVLHFADLDPLYDALVFGVVFEPRDRVNADGTLRAKGWYPFIPYEFQSRLMRWIQGVMTILPGSPEALLGRGDGILEKARGMAGSWTFCAHIGNRFKFDDGYIAGLMSYRVDEVDKTNSTNTLFAKVEGYLGLDRRVAPIKRMRIGAAEVEVPLRSPDWMVPTGYAPSKHNQELTLAHPERTNLVLGYTTTSEAFTSARMTQIVMDEAAKFDQFDDVWNAASAVADHRFALSSAWLLKGPAFRNLARAAEKAQRDGTPGPSFMRLKPEEHPERDEVWREEIEARHTGTPSAKAALAREYDLDYEAGRTGYIYREKGITIVPAPLSFSPSTQSLDFCIDPGVRDLCAFHLLRYAQDLHRYGLLASYVNSGKPAEFYASLYMATPLARYTYGPDEERIMDWFASWGKHIRFNVGDPAGKQRGGGSATSFYGDFLRATEEISDGQRRVAIWSSDKHAFNHLLPRHAALRWLLDLLDVNDAPDTLLTLDAVNDHHYKEVPERETVSIPLTPVRTPGHDRVTALEFYACHRRVGSEPVPEDRPRDSDRPILYAMSGKPMQIGSHRGLGVAQ